MPYCDCLLTCAKKYWCLLLLLLSLFFNLGISKITKRASGWRDH